MRHCGINGPIERGRILWKLLMSDPSCNSTISDRQVLQVWMDAGILTAFGELLNNSSHFQFEQSRQKIKADLAIVDWRNANTNNRHSVQARIKQSDLPEGVPILIVAIDCPELFSMFESVSNLDCSRLEIVHEYELGSTFLDIRILKMLTTVSQQSAQKLSEHNERIVLDTVMKHSNDWMVVKSLDHRFLHVSKKFSHALNIPPEDIVGKNDLEIGISPELVLGKPGTDWKGFWALDKEVINKGKHVVLQPVISAEDELEERRETTDKVPLKDRYGNVFALFVCVSELKQQKPSSYSIDELSEAEFESLRFWETKHSLDNLPALTALDDEQKRVDALKQESEQAFTAKNHFIASASHDLRQPLHALGLYLRAVEDKVDDDGLYLVDRLKDCVDSMNDLLTSLLDISRLDANVVSAELSSFSVDELMHSLRDECDSIARGKSLQLTCTTDESQVYTDPILLRRVIRNLLMNAINYTEDGKISMTAARVGNHVKIAVADTGIGIPEEKQLTVFEEFAKLKSHSQLSSPAQQGLGLGLSIVKRLCQLLDIKIELQSVVGKGTRITAMVPLGKSASLNGAAFNGLLDIDLAGDLPASPAVSAANDKLILVVDDEPLVCEAVETLLAHSGYQTISAASPQQALEKLDAVSLIPDAIVVDFRLSGDMTGLDAIRIINDTLGVSTPALIVTGDTSNDGLKEITGAGYQHLHKPVDVDELLDIVRKTVYA